MQLEIYEKDETMEYQEAQDEGRADLLGELNLKEKHQTVTLPFPELEDGAFKVYETLYPNGVDLRSYDGFLPTKVLRLYKAYKDDFERICIYSDRITDPVMIGFIKSTCFIMARWGEALAPFEELRVKALEVWKRKREAKLRTYLANLESDAERHFGGEYVNPVY